MNLVCTGALTNIALLLIMFPEAASYIEQIVLMGGAIGSGNTNPCAEFNMQASFSPHQGFSSSNILHLNESVLQMAILTAAVFM